MQVFKPFVFALPTAANPAEGSQSPSSSHLQKELKLTTCPLSGVPSTTETFHKELKGLSSIHGETLQSPSTQRISASRSCIVVDGAEIISRRN
ncbi:hypothetical protein ElyMa_006782100 [Elysia marginata]|uniref:Uncharacterized protein n=1 Tax=Elysia marginata TaxID=1093978 RepID=A0AAV4J0I1_9GAST|nr:hypothetical protein ElyMa_006782100 [Elysia marginata]